MAVNKVFYGGNTLIDLTGDTVTAADVASGKTFHLPDGTQAVGSMPSDGVALPSAYQRVEYIAASGTQYINTGVLPTENNVANVDFELTGYSNNSYIALVSASSHMYLVHFYHSSGSNIHFVPCWYAYKTGDYYTTLSLSKRYRAICSSYNDTAKNGGMAITTDGAFTSNNSSGTQSYTPTNSYYIFARNNDSAVSYQASAKLYHLALYTDGNLVRDFYPCYRKADGVIGLYDTVTEAFFTNAGTGTFTKGSDI